ncbi:pyridoxamine 5'-phosphate oxidase family protein [Stackebrandtia nassauensis]|uniref:Pyridoxamine 5'-phosphate oxidase-related FMN-binding protein n=1 Tax=Stackebrandtia nassauensis (strain DSM 44728 / CIP 108903 / NRRL B-16338 / NBRC 102104 / LLR-40K-21) TaxID=446470 RepID=D3PV65_STANL|nr:pyridoxamine 5'-phosphate oxidase family protein [Stackebrandtia nassauensis]ADD41118.1 pyridoxamine 5'-phosphate oxidase-related FMN- binding protein [Stackebrandtia nassauensis DSM 44728]
MGHVYEEINERLAAFIDEQPMFFVGTAPSGDSGHVNVSPKGMAGTFKILGPHRVAYLDWGGSGVEGTAHMRQNGRVCVMFCSFGRSPKILRLHGTGTPVLRGEPRFAELLARFDAAPDVHGVRGVIEVDVTRVSDSCGYGVPYMELKGDRTMLVDVNERRSDADIAKRRLETNTLSLDGLPGVAGTAAEARYRRKLEADH